MSYDLSELLNLNPTEKLRLIDALWGSLDEQSDDVTQLTERRRQEVRRRDAEMSADSTADADPTDIDRLLKRSDD